MLHVHSYSYLFLLYYTNKGFFYALYFSPIVIIGSHIAFSITISSTHSVSHCKTVQKGFTYSSSIEERARVPEMSLGDVSSSWGVEISVENYLIQIHVSPSFSQDVTRQPCNTWSWTNVQEKERRDNPKRTEDRYLDANQKSERFVPVPCHHVPYLSQILWCSTSGPIDTHFHRKGQGKGKSVHHYPLYNLTGTLDEWNGSQRSGQLSQSMWVKTKIW